MSQLQLLADFVNRHPLCFFLIGGILIDAAGICIGLVTEDSRRKYERRSRRELERLYRI